PPRRRAERSPNEAFRYARTITDTLLTGGRGPETAAEPDLPAPTRFSTGQPGERRAPRLAHLRSLDGLRGLAVLSVVLYHFSPDIAPGGFLGVDLFFVLSGFLITSLLVNEWSGTRAISLRSFWTRRAKRLVPALLLLLAVVGVYSLLLDDRVDGQRFAVDGLSALGYVANWH